MLCIGQNGYGCVWIIFPCYICHTDANTDAISTDQNENDLKLKYYESLTNTVVDVFFNVFCFVVT